MAAPGVRHVVLDGVHFQAPFKHGDFVASLEKPPLPSNIQQPIKTLIGALFEQDFGNTVASLFMDPKKMGFQVGPKKVRLLEFINKWNNYCDKICTFVTENGISTRTALMEFINVHMCGSKGEEPWYYAQILPPKIITDALNLAGLVLTAEAFKKSYQIISIAENQPFLAGELLLDNFRSVDRGAGAGLYLVANEVKIIPGEVSGTKFSIVFSREGPRNAVHKTVDKRKIRQEQINWDSSVLTLGTVIGGDFFIVNRSPRWHHYSANSLVRYRTEALSVEKRKFFDTKSLGTFSYKRGASINELVYKPLV